MAIKVLSRSSSKEADRRQRVGREARLLASLNHPNIAAILYDTVDVGDRYGLVLEFVSGETLNYRQARAERTSHPSADMLEAIPGWQGRSSTRSNAATAPASAS